MIELYVNDILVDIRGDEVVAIDFGSFSIATPQEREGLRSYSFSLPRTNNNKKAFESAERLDNISPLPFSQIDARLYVDGVDCGVKFCELVTAGATYDVRLYGANSGIFATLKDLELQLLDLSDLDHIANLQLIFDSRTNTTGFIYPLINYNDDAPNQIIDNDHAATPVDFMLPALFLKDILARIFKGVGYTLINEVENDPVYEAAQIILPASGQLKSNLDARKYSGLYISTQNQTAQENAHEIDISFNTKATPDKYSELVGFGIVQDDISFHLALDLKVTNDKATNVLATINIFTTQGVLNFPVILTPGINLIHVEGDMTELKSLPQNNDNLITGAININLSGDVGDMAFVTVDAGSSITLSNVIITQQSNVDYGQFISMSAILPAITQADFISQYMQMFCLLMDVNEDTKTVTLFNFNKVTKQLSNPYDWSSKVDYTTEPAVSFIIDDYAQVNKFLYTKDGTEVQPEGTNGEIDVSNKNLEIEKDVITLNFASSMTIELLKGLILNSIGVYSGTVASNQKTPRILCLNRIQVPGKPITYYETINLNNTLDTETDIPLTYFIDSTKDFNLGFANNLLSRYYGSLLNVMQNVKIVTLPLRLTAADISQLDFSRPVYIDKFDCYFYISKITGFEATSTKPTMVELVKINIYG